MPAPDEQKVVDLLGRCPDDVPGVVAVLCDLQPLAESRDPRRAEDGLACFNYLYREITEEIQDRLVAGDLFRDPEFMVRFDVEFARRYFRAVRAHAAGEPVPRSWGVLLDRRSDDSITPMQFAVAGVNAHVNYDLAFALIRTCTALGRGLGPTERADYDAINTIFAKHMRSLRQHFENRFERLVDDLLLDDLADGGGDLTVVLARDAAGRRAEHLWTLRGRPHECAQEHDTIDWRTSMLGRGILTFPLG